MKEHIRILELGVQDNLPELVDDSTELSVATVRELVEAGYLAAIDGSAYLSPRITLSGREYLQRLGHAREPSSPERPGLSKVFISWSGAASQEVALALRSWLPKVVPQVQPWVSSEDIPKGRRWGREIDDQLEATSFCIVCIVPGNAREPWINFEAGAIAKTVENSHVSPLLVEVSEEVLVGGPLSMFQATKYQRDDVAKLVATINRVCPPALKPDQITDRFDKYWDELNSAIQQIRIREELLDQHDESHASKPIPSEQEDILVYIAECGNHPPSLSEIAYQTGGSELRVDYHLDQLVQRELINDNLAMGSQTTYSLVPLGRAYLVENELI